MTHFTKSKRRRAVRLIPLFLCLAILATAASLVPGAKADEGVPGSGDPPVPTDVYAHLSSEWGISTTAPAPGTGASVTASQAQETADTEYGFLEGTIVSAHLVLFSEPDYGEAASEEAAAEDDATFTPLYMNHLAWLIVMRNSTPPAFGPAGKPRTDDLATIAVFVDATSGEDIEAVTLPPS